MQSCLQGDLAQELQLEDSHPFLAIPIAEIEILSDDFIEELQKNVEVNLNEEEIYTAVFYSDPYVQSKQSLFPKFSIALPVPVLDSVVSLPVPLFQEALLREGTLSGDQIIFTLNSTESSDVSVTLAIDQLSRDGKPFVVSYIIPYNGTGLSTLTTDPVDLSGLNVDFSEQRLTLRYDARREDGTRIRLPLSFLQITGLDFSYLEGDIGRSTITTGLQRIPIVIQDSLVEGSYQFLDPKLHFNISNSFGIPIGVRVKEVIIIQQDGSQTKLTSSVFDEVVMLEYPALDEKGAVVLSQISLDRNNSNIEDIAHRDIVAIDYNLDIILNPTEKDAVPFFVVEESRAVVTAQLELSFDALVNFVSVEKSIPVDLSRLDTFEFLRIKMVVDNGIPLSFEPNLILSDDSGKRNFSLVPDDERIIAPSATDSDGNVITKSENVFFYSLSDEDIGRISLSDFLLAELIMVSPNQGASPARITPGLKMEVRIGAEAKFR